MGADRLFGFFVGLSAGGHPAPTDAENRPQRVLPTKTKKMPGGLGRTMRRSDVRFEGQSRHRGSRD